MIITNNKFVNNGNYDFYEGQNFSHLINLTGVGIGNPYAQSDSNWFEGWLPQMYSFGIASKDQIAFLLSGNCSDRTLTTECAIQADKFRMFAFFFLLYNFLTQKIREFVWAFAFSFFLIATTHYILNINNING